MKKEINETNERKTLPLIKFRIPETPELTGTELQQAMQLREHASALIEEAKSLVSPFQSVFAEWAAGAATEKDVLTIWTGEGPMPENGEFPANQTLIRRGWQPIFRDSMQAFIRALCDGKADKAFEDSVFKSVKHVDSVKKDGEDEIGKYFADVRIVGTDQAGLMKKVIQIFVKAGQLAFEGDFVGATGKASHLFYDVAPMFGEEAIKGVIQARVLSNAAFVARKEAKRLEEAALTSKQAAIADQQSQEAVAKARRNGAYAGGTVAGHVA